MMTMQGVVYFILILAVFCFPIVYFLIGSQIQKHHLSSLDRREALYKHIEVSNLKTVPECYLEKGCTVELVTGSVVMSIDTFRAMLISIRQMFGGSLSAYETIASIARREVLVRMQEEALGLNATAIINVRFGTSNLDGQAAQQQGGKLEFFCYGTALIPKR